MNHGDIVITIYDIVTKLIGPVQPVGETNADTSRLENLGALTDLVNRLLMDIEKTATAKERHEASMAALGRSAQEFLDEVRQSLS